MYGKKSHTSKRDAATKTAPLVDVSGQAIYYTILNYFGWFFQININDTPNPITLGCSKMVLQPKTMQQFESDMYQNPASKEFDPLWLGMNTSKDKIIDIPKPTTIEEFFKYDDQNLICLEFDVPEDVSICIDTAQLAKTTFAMFYHRASDNDVHHTPFLKELMTTDLSFVVSPDRSDFFLLNIGEDEFPIFVEASSNDPHLYYIEKISVATTPAVLTKKSCFII